MSFDNTVRDGRGRIVGFRCWQCDEVKTRMWGTICNRCRFADELARSIRAIAEGWPSPSARKDERAKKPMNQRYDQWLDVAAKDAFKSQVVGVMVSRKCPACGEPMEYDAGQPMGDDEPDIAPEWFCECGEVILAEDEPRL